TCQAGIIILNHCFFDVLLHPHRTALFPYTTLFRSHGACERMDDLLFGRVIDVPLSRRGRMQSARLAQGVDGLPVLRNEASPRVRSEEHTSELQSRENLVCRLLLEKKKYGR